MSGQAQPPAPGRILPFDASERTLANGLKVIVVPTGFPNIVSLQIPVMTGSRNEVEPGKSGFAHFFEHMMFRGTQAYPPDAYQAIVTQAGARQNAFTSDDFTNYHTTFAKEDLETILKIEADRFQSLDYSSEGFKTESRAVLGEYNKNSANPIQKLIEVQREHAFKSHTYRHTTMGFLKDIEDMPNQFEYSKTFFDRWYRPEYATVIVAGDVKADEVFPLVEKYWGSWKPGTYKVEVPVEPAPAGPVVAHVPWSAPTLPWVSVAIRTPAFGETSREWAALDVLSDLAFGPTSPLYKSLVEVRAEGRPAGRLLPAQPRPVPDDGLRAREEGGGHALRARPHPAHASRRRAAWRCRRSASRTRRTTRATGSCARSTTPSRSRRRSRASCATAARSTRSTSSTAPTTPSRPTTSSRPRSATWWTRGSCRRRSRRIRCPRRSRRSPPSPSLPVAAPAPLPPGAAPAAPAPATKPGAGAAFTPLVQRTKLPQLDVKLLFRVGSAHDPRGKEGLAALAAAMIADAGSRAMTIAEIKQALFPMAASFDARVDKELTSFTARVHRDNWARFAEIALPQLEEPGFREEDLRRLKDQQKNELVEDLRTNNEEELGKERLQALVFRGTPYGHPVLGSVAGLEAITLDDVKDFVRKAYTRAALRVGLAGDLPAGLEARLGQALARLPEGPALAGARRRRGGAAEGTRRRDRREGDARDRDLVRPRDRRHPLAPRLPRALPGAHLAGRAPLLDLAPLPAHPRGARDELRRLRLHRGLPARDVPVLPRPEPRAARADLRGLDPAGAAGERADGAQDRAPRAAAARSAERPDAGRLRVDPRLPDEERVRDDSDPGPAARLRARLGVVRDPGVHGLHARPAREADARRRERRRAQAPLGRRDLTIVAITKDAKGLAETLLADTPSTIRYDAPKPELAERGQDDRRAQARPSEDKVEITPVAEVFAR